MTSGGGRVFMMHFSVCLVGYEGTHVHPQQNSDMQWNI